MENKKWLKAYFNQPLQTKKETYEFIANYGENDQLSHENINRALRERELASNLQIAPHVVLPHFESLALTESSVLIIHLQQEISCWDQTAADIKLVIAILLKTNESLEIKKEIALFTRSLADETFIQNLLCSKKEAIFMDYLKKI